ncbi:NrsF family protein [Sorangium sp. So ce1335]|uniref:NrsF family protein n=1 Tax=Sorangium sp. So ce1335 TaxID=3133335 RepID=UPI003F5EE5A4
MNRHEIPPRFASTSAPPAALYSNIRAAIQKTPSSTVPVRARLLGAMAAIPGVMTAVLVGTDRIMDQSPLRADLGAGSPGRLVVVLTSLLVFTLLTTLVALRRGRLGLGSGERQLTVAAVLVVPVYAFSTLALPLRSDNPAVLSAAASLHPLGLPCFVVAALVGLLVLVTFALALRWSVPVARGPRGAALGASAGAWAGLSVFIHCPAFEPTHLFIGHIVPIVAFTALGVIAVPHVLRP